jgi:cytochrome c oxidase subunit 2
MAVAMAVQAIQFPGAHSALDPAGPQAAAIKAWLWNPMYAAAVVTFLLVTGALLWAAFRRRDSAEPSTDLRHERGLARAVGVATTITILVVFAVLVLDGVVGHASSGAPTDALRVTVTGRQWWWEVVYPGHSADEVATTANEIHIPVGRPVVNELRSSHVIHSLWVPSLGPKRDLIPGRTNTLRLQADRPGVYRGVCAEFCGAQHAKMAFVVTAEPAERFAAWLSSQRGSPQPPADSLAQRGEQVFLGGSCPLCHSVAGTSAGGRIGPDLSHLASRQTIAAGTRPNTRGNLAGWILDPQSMKPGTKMPPSRLTGADLHALTAYLESLR